MKKTNKNAAMKEAASSSKICTASAKKRHGESKMQNLVEEVEVVLSQDDDNSDDEVFVDNKSEDRKMVSKGIENNLTMTPRRRTTKVETAVEMQTPRRSERKSVKPAQDYEDIVAKKTLRSLKKEDINQSVGDEMENLDALDEPRWTPAKVGRGSQKRKKRKSRRTIFTHDNEEDQRIVVAEEMLVAIENNEDENKENLSPQDLLKQRKVSKENDYSKANSRKSNELKESAEKKRQSPRETVLQPLILENMQRSNEIEKKDNIVAEAVEEEQNKEEKRAANTLVSDLVDLADGLEVPLSLTITEGSEQTIVEPIYQNPEESNQKSNLNETTEIQEIKDSTFNTSDCIIISPEPIMRSVFQEEPSSTDKKEECQMQPLLLSDDSVEDINQENVEKENTSENSSPRSLTTKLPKIKISFADTNLDDLKTPEQRPKPYRFPTPYRSGKAKNLSFESNKDMSDEDDDGSKRSEPTLSPEHKGKDVPDVDSGLKSSESTFPPKHKDQDISEEDYGLKSSYPNIAAKIKEQKIIKPQKSTITTNLNAKEIILRSIRKKRSNSLGNDRPPKATNRVKFHSPANQTTFIEDIDLLITRSAAKPKVNRKRVDVATDETNITKRRKRSLSYDESVMQMKLKAHASLTPNKSRVTPLKLQRTKIPNFAAIHQRNFNNMENIADHLQRKAERAKILTASNSKVRPASAQKIYPVVRDQNTSTTFGAGAAESNFLIKPKALKKIDLNNIKVSDENTSQVTNLPNPQILLQKNLAIVVPMQPVKKQEKSAAASAKKVIKTAQESLQKRLITVPKPRFNLSTHVDTSVVVNVGKGTNQPQENKMVSRRQRHMDMFKGRMGGRSHKDQENANEIIRGVRSNRRFELQMRHRKNLEHHTE